MEWIHVIAGEMQSRVGTPSLELDSWLQIISWVVVVLVGIMAYCVARAIDRI